MKGCSAQYGRAMRYLKVAEEPSADKQSKEDDLITFFLHCWHLKDHIKNDESISREIGKRAVKKAHEDGALKVCQDVANGMKHFTSKDSNMDGRSDIIAVVGGEGSVIVVHPKITLEDGSERRAIDVAREAMESWTSIIQAEGIPLQ